MSKAVLLLLTAFCSASLAAQEQQPDSSSSQWKFSAWAEMFIIPGEKDFFNPTFYARHKNLHLEGRYNYEDMNTASLWVGRRFRFGKEVEFVFVPMAPPDPGFPQRTSAERAKSPAPYAATSCSSPPSPSPGDCTP